MIAWIQNKLLAGLPHTNEICNIGIMFAKAVNSTLTDYTPGYAMCIRWTFSGAR